MGLCNLKNVDEEINKRKVVVERYRTNLKGNAGIIFQEDKMNVRNNYSYFPVLLKDYKISRDELFLKLKSANVIARKYFYPLTSSFECYHGRFEKSSTPVARYVADNIMTLPLYSDLGLDSVDFICELITG
jgi:dTDP-4-amino-4,6-dideoxygalactose transaminase